MYDKVMEADFETLDELYERKDKIREEVQQYNVKTLELYKWYFFYQLCLISVPTKEAFWDYLVKKEVDEFTKGNLEHEYMKFCKHRKKIARL